MSDNLRHQAPHSADPPFAAQHAAAGASTPGRRQSTFSSRTVGGQSAAAPQAFDPWILWVTVRRSWPWAVPLGAVLAGLVAFLVLQSFVPRYRASHLLEANQDFVVFKGVMPMVTDLARTEKSLFFNPIILDPVLADARLRKAPSLSDPERAEANLHKNLSIASGGTETRLIVSYEDIDRDAAAMVCNAIVDSYLRQRDSFDTTRVNNLERWLDPEIHRWEEEVAGRQQRVHSLSEKAIGFAPGQRLQSAENDSKVALLTGLRSQIGDLKIELALFDARQDAALAVASLAGASEDGELSELNFKTHLGDSQIVTRSTPGEAEIAQAVEADAKVQLAKSNVARYRKIMQDLEDRDMVRISRDYYNEMQQNLADAEAKTELEREAAKSRVADLLQRQYDDEYERQTQLAQQRAEIQKQEFEIQRERLRASSAVKYQATIETEKKKAELARQSLIAKLEILQEQYDEERVRLEQFGGMTAELQFAQDELAVASGVLTKLRDRVAAIRTERRQDGAVRTLSAATPPRSPLEAAPYKKLVLAAAAAFALPFCLSVLWEYRVHRVTDAATYEKGAGLAPVVGEVARLPASSRSRKGRRVFEESVDTLRANLFLSVDTNPTRSIAVVSSMSGEGKSSVSSQLAISIAKATGQTVLLVDGDVRSPDQHDIFGIPMGPGFTGVLAGEASLTDAVDSSLGDLIHILPAGSLTASPHRLISPSSVRNFVDIALVDYGFVVFDTAPVLSASESLAISSSVDLTLLCVMRDVSRVDSVTRTTRRLEAAGANIAGTVFSGVSARSYVNRYGDYHYALANPANS